MSTVGAASMEAHNIVAEFRRRKEVLDEKYRDVL